MRTRRQRVLTGTLVFLLSCAAQAEKEKLRQDGSDPEDREYKAEAPERPQDMPLALLPKAPSKRHVVPRPRALEAIDLLLKRVVSQEELTRETASRSLLEAKSDWVSGLARRIDRLAERGDKTAMKTLLKKARETTRARLKQEKSGKVETPDYLEIALEHAEPSSHVWRDLAQLLAISRMLSAIGTTEAVREIIRIHVRFGEFMRIECQRQLEDLGDLAIAALIETRRHQAPKIAKWAEKRLRLRKKLIPHNAVRTDDPQALADTLVALGSLRDPESTRLLISFAGTERSQIRLAARQGLSLMGDVAAWQLRDAYLNTTGKRPPRDWTWKRTARELFTEFDRLRLEKLYRLFSGAMEAQGTGDLKKMREGFDQILLLNPNFDRRADMADGYIRYAESVLQEEPTAAMIALERATRISEDTDERNKARGLRKLLEASKLKQGGIVDQGLLDQIKELNPDLAQAADKLRRTDAQRTSWIAGSRYLVASLTSLLALIGAAWILIGGWRRRKEVNTSELPQRSRRTSPDPEVSQEPVGKPEVDTASKSTDPSHLLSGSSVEQPSSVAKANEASRNAMPDGAPDSPQTPDAPDGARPDTSTES